MLEMSRSDADNGGDAMLMDHDDAKEYLRSRMQDYLVTHHQVRNLRANFQCVNASAHAHADRNPSMHFYPDSNRCKCFACGVSYDIFEFIRIDFGLSGFDETFKKACDLYDVQIVRYVKKDNDYQKAFGQRCSEHPGLSGMPYGKEFRRPSGTIREIPDQMSYYGRCVDLRKHSEKAMCYLAKRGLREETLDYFQIGYDPSWHHPGTRNRPTERIIIPNSSNSYLARVLDDTLILGEYDHPKMKVGRQHLFNSRAIRPQSVVFVVEGEIDAMSIVQFGIPCVGLGSASQYRKLSDFLRLNPDNAKGSFFLFCLDDDKAGKERAMDLSRLLDADGFQCAMFNGLSAPFKDPNERLQMDPEGLGDALRRAWNECQKLRIRRESA